jgi:O-antigen/teichoic acid export membrane protein
LLSVSPALSEDFASLLRMLCMISGVAIVSRSLASPLWAFQRMDVVNLNSTIGLTVQLFVMWLGFHLGWGVHSFVVAAAVPPLLAIVICGAICFKNGYYPACKYWFSLRWPIFREMFAYGRDGMLLTIGSQLVNATQITIISRTLGLDAAASFSIATKLYSMSIQLFHKVVESAAPGLAELFVRGQLTQFMRRYWDMIFLTLATSSVGAVALAAGNNAFVSIWTGGKVSWSVEGDLFLGLMILSSSLSRSFITVFGITKNLKPVRLLYFIEGLVYVPCAVLSARWFGVEGVVATSLLVHLLVTLTASANASSKIIGRCIRLILPVSQIAAGIATGSALAWAALSLDLTPFARLSCASIPCLMMIVAAWKLIMPTEIKIRLQTDFNPMVQRLRPSLKRK